MLAISDTGSATRTGDAVPRQHVAELRAESVSVDFGGLRALNDVTLALSTGDLLGLIGPNGAGKTTLLNVLTGFQRPTAGQVHLDGETGSRWTPQQWVRKGVARTFQGARVFGRLTVRENVEVGAVAVGASRAEAGEQADALVRHYGLGEYAQRRAGTPPAGLRRRPRLAPALAPPPPVPPLAAPAPGPHGSGPGGAGRPGPEVSGPGRCGVVIVEHSMPVIMRLCRRIHVLDGGQTLMEGTPEEVRNDPDVRAAYLGAT